MENRPEFVGIWYGLSKLGVISSLINTNLKNKVLIHSIEVAKPKIIIYDEELESCNFLLIGFCCQLLSLFSIRKTHFSYFGNTK